MIYGNYYDIELSDNNSRANQPDKILLKLKPHQLTSLHKAMEMETTGGIKYRFTDRNSFLSISNMFYSHNHMYENNYLTDAENNSNTEINISTNVGILGDMVGYGKTLIALSLIAGNNLNNIYINNNYTKTYNNYKNYSYLNITCSNNLIPKNNNIINTTLVIVPRGPVYVQWEKTITSNTSLKVLAIDNLNFIKKFLPKYDGTNKQEIFNFFESYDIVLIKNTTLKILCDSYYNYNNNFNIIKRWKRIMIDEAHDIISKIPSLQYYYLWLISGTYDDILKRINNNANNIIYSNGIKEIMNDNFINLMLVKNNYNFIKNSFNIPDPIEKYYLCKLPSNISAIKNFISNSILEKINANDFAGAIKDLGGKNETEDNIIELVSKELKRDLFNKETERDYISHLDIPAEQKQQKLKNINHEIENQINKINDLTERIKSLTAKNCIICMDTLTNPIMLECTHLFCGKCVLKWLATNKNCPYCRSNITGVDKLIAIVSEKTENTEIPEDNLSKEETFLNIIKNKPDGKFLVFSKNDNGFDIIKTKMMQNNIQFELLKGNTSHMMNILDKFKKGIINIILLNTQYAGSGIDINYATDVIIFHSMGLDKQQAIGRAQRVGRNIPLHIHNLCYEHEI
jgi:superfamily II DNA or RNA helicase